MKKILAAASVVLLATVSVASAQTTVFEHDFENATAGDLSAAGTLGSPSVGTLNATGGFVSMTRPAFTSGNNGQSNEIAIPGAGSFNDVGTPEGNYLTVNLSEPAAVTGVLGAGQTTTVDFSLGGFGTNNSTIFKHVHVIGKSSAGAEVFQILWRVGSNAGNRAVFARELGQDNTNFVAVSPPVVRDGNTIDYDFESNDGTTILEGFNFGLVSTNSDSSPGNTLSVSVTIDENGWNASATPTDGNFTETPASGLGIASGATDLASIDVFTSLHELNNATGNNGFWIDNIVVATDLTVEPSPVAAGDLNTDGVVDCDDIDEFIDNDGSAVFDVDSSGVVDAADVEFLVTTLVQTSNGVVGTFLGDLNCDGQVNVLGDALILVTSLGSAATSYGQGDINLDGQVNVLGDALILVTNLGNNNAN